MLTTSVFLVVENGQPPFYEERRYSSTITDITKSISYIHQKFSSDYPDHSKPLEVSTHSPLNLGRALSAFNLMVDLPDHRRTSVESAYHASKVYEHASPFTHMLNLPAWKAKKEASKLGAIYGKVTGFEFFDQKFPLQPMTLFYDWLYIKALWSDSNRHLFEGALCYDAFSDVWFNHNVQVACHARTLAMIVGAYRSFVDFDEILDDPHAFARELYAN